MVRSPLIIGGEMNGFDDFTMSLLTNEELLNIERDTHCAHMVTRKVVDGNEQIIWLAPAKDASVNYVALFNAGESVCDITVDIARLGIKPTNAYDIWNFTTEAVGDKLTATVNPHGVRLFKLL